VTAMAPFFQWVRQTSERNLMIDAQDRIGRKLGARRPAPPRGAEEIFWRRVYVPVFHRLPQSVRDAMIARMPGSHRKRWPAEPPLRGPAV
jgi:hypothetical protein